MTATAATPTPDLPSRYSIFISQHPRAHRIHPTKAHPTFSPAPPHPCLPTSTHMPAQPPTPTTTSSFVLRHRLQCSMASTFLQGHASFVAKVFLACAWLTLQFWLLLAQATRNLSGSSWEGWRAWVPGLSFSSGPSFSWVLRLTRTIAMFRLVVT